MNYHSVVLFVDTPRYVIDRDVLIKDICENHAFKISLKDKTIFYDQDDKSYKFYYEYWVRPINK